MELKQLRFLTVCAQTGSFSKAANILFTAQSNVSKVIKSLEEELGMDLFERRSNGIFLTKAGEKVYEFAVMTLESAEKIVDYTKQLNREELRVSWNPSSWLASLFRDYFNEFEREDTSYYIMTACTDDIIKRLSAEIDQMGFVYVMEEQLPMLDNHFRKNHLTFLALKKTSAYLYFGSEESMAAYENASKTGVRPALVQGFEDEFTLQSFWHDRYADDTDLVTVPRLAVTTNSDYVMSELLAHTRLANVSGAYLSDEGTRRSKYAISLFTEDDAVIFGCLIRNDRNLGKAQLHFLNYVKKRLSEI